MGGIADALTGGKPKESKAVADARKRQEASLKAQEAATLRAQIETDKQEADLSGKSAAQRRALAARRRGRGGLEFTGPASGLKETLGG